MKNIKKIVSLMLAGCMLLSLAACSSGKNEVSSEPQMEDAVDTATTGEKSTETVDKMTEVTVAGGKKVAVLCSPLGWGEENERMLAKYIEKYGEENFVINTMPEDADVQTITSLCSDVARNPDVAVLILNECCIGAISGIRAAKEINPDLLVISVLPGDEAIESAQVADMLCLPGLEELSEAAGRAAVKKELECVVVEAPADALGSTDAQRRIQGLHNVCDPAGIEVVINTLPGATDMNSRNALLQSVKDDVYSKLEQYGDKVGFFSVNCFINVPIITAIAEKQCGYVVGLSDPGPFALSYCDAFNISAPEEHSMDIAWTNSAISEKVTEIGMAGHYANWKYPFLSGFMAGSIDYAFAYINGEAEKGDIDAWMNYYFNAIGADSDEISFKTLEWEGVKCDNYVIVTSEFEFYGEDIK